MVGLLGAGPSGLEGAALAFDSTRGRAVLFGGRVSVNGFLADTWEWDGQSWQQRQPVTSPPPRGFAAMAFDPARARTVLFGGANQTGGLADTWEWDGTNWRAMTVSTAPAARFSAAMAFEPRSQTVLLAGAYSPTRFDDTWSWNGSTWQKLAQTGFGGANAGCCTAGNEVLALVLTDASRFQLQRWTDAAWQPVDVMSPPSGRIAAAPGGGVLVWGGPLNGPPAASVWNGLSWRSVPAGPGPAARDGHCMTLDLVRRRVVLFGGMNGNTLYTDVWEWDGKQWLLAAPSGAGPTVGNDAALAYDLGRRRTVLVGGDWLSGLTWEWDGTQWHSRVTPVTPVHRRNFPAAAYDVLSSRVMVFGGSSSSAWLQDCWTYDGITWTPGPVPDVAIERPALAWDPSRVRMLLLGVSSGNARAWELNNGWLPTTAPLGQPGLVLGTSAVHDVMRGRVVAFVSVPGQSYIEESSPAVPAVDNLGGGCAAGIAPRLEAVGQPLLGATTWLDATDTGNRFVFLVMATSSGNLPVGACTLVPALGQFAGFRPTPTGFAMFALSVPRAAGLLGLQVRARSSPPIRELRPVSRRPTRCG